MQLGVSHIHTKRGSSNMQFVKEKRKMTNKISKHSMQKEERGSEMKESRQQNREEQSVRSKEMYNVKINLFFDSCHVLLYHSKSEILPSLDCQSQVIFLAASQLSWTMGSAYSRGPGHQPGQYTVLQPHAYHARSKEKKSLEKNKCRNIFHKFYIHYIT